MPRPLPAITVYEGVSSRFRARLVDQAGEAVPGSTLEERHVWIRDYDSGNPVNGRTGDELDGLSIGEDGALVLDLRPDDNRCLSATLEELHELTIEAVWDGGTKTAINRQYIKVRNLSAIEPES